MVPFCTIFCAAAVIDDYGAGDVAAAVGAMR